MGVGGALHILTGMCAYGVLKQICKKWYRELMGRDPTFGEDNISGI